MIGLVEIAGLCIGAVMGWLTRTHLVPCGVCGERHTSLSAPVASPEEERATLEALRAQREGLQIKKEIAKEKKEIDEINRSSRPDFDLFGGAFK